MISLCIETATARVGIALTQNGHLLAESLLDAPGGRQTALLMPELHHLLSRCNLKVNQIDLFACAIGPGTFTGVRTGIAVTQGLALAWGKICYGVSTLAMLAMNLPHTEYQVCPMLDARKNEVYTALYRVSGHPAAIIPDCVITPADFLRFVTVPTIFLGEGAVRYQEMISQTLGENALFVTATEHVLRPSAGCLLAEKAFLDGLCFLPEQLLPTYLRLSEAELSRQKNI